MPLQRESHVLLRDHHQRSVYHHHLGLLLNAHRRIFAGLLIGVHSWALFPSHSIVPLFTHHSIAGLALHKPFYNLQLLIALAVPCSHARTLLRNIAFSSAFLGSLWCFCNRNEGVVTRSLAACIAPARCLAVSLVVSTLTAGRATTVHGMDERLLQRIQRRPPIPVRHSHQCFSRCLFHLNLPAPGLALKARITNCTIDQHTQGLGG